MKNVNFNQGYGLVELVIIEHMPHLFIETGN